MVALTIGMATYNDFDGVYFTVQSLCLYHDLEDTEILVVDNFGCETTEKYLAKIPRARYIRSLETVGTAAPRDRVFREARGEAVLCTDSHVLFSPGVIARLKAYYRDRPGTRDLLQGPLLYDNGTTISTHFDPVWRSQMWGVWGTDPRGKDPEGEPFEIPSQGLGAFSCRKDAWLGFNPLFRGFGGEEGYIHEKFRQAGARCLCLPWFRWTHRFGRPAGVPYPLAARDKLRNYIIGHQELGLDLQPALDHFTEHLGEERVKSIAAETLAETSGITLAPGIDDFPLPAPKGVRNAEPLVSCICLTYNRAPDHLFLLEEAIEAFVRQDYPNKELIVFNDTPGQELYCNAPGVRVVNHPARYASLGEKANAAVALARGDLIAVWDDDDISLPWRLSHSVSAVGDADYFNPRNYWYLNTKGLHADHTMGNAHNSSLFSRDAFNQVGGYPAISLGVDQAMDRRLTSLDRIVDPRRGATPLRRDEWFYIFRWGVSPHHLSANGNPDGYEQLGQSRIQRGQFLLTPHWREAYDEQTANFAVAPELASVAR